MSTNYRLFNLLPYSRMVLFRLTSSEWLLCFYPHKIENSTKLPFLLIWRCTSKNGNGSGSDRVESPCTQNRNPKSKPEPETDSGGNPSPKPNPRIPETRMDTQNPRINIHIFTCINKRQQIINIFMSQLSINLIV